LKLPEFLHGPFSAAMSQSLLLPAFVTLFGIVASLFLVGFMPSASTRQGNGLPGRVSKGGDTEGDYGVHDDGHDDIEPVAARIQLGFVHNGSHVDEEQHFPAIAKSDARCRGDEAVESTQSRQGFDGKVLRTRRIRTPLHFRPARTISKLIDLALSKLVNTL